MECGLFESNKHFFVRRDRIGNYIVSLRRKSQSEQSEILTNDLVVPIYRTDCLFSNRFATDFATRAELDDNILTLFQ